MSQQLDLILGTNGQSPLPMQRFRRHAHSSDVTERRGLGRYKQRSTWRVCLDDGHHPKAKPFLPKNARTAEESDEVKAVVASYAPKASKNRFETMNWKSLSNAARPSAMSDSTIQFAQEDGVGLEFSYNPGEDPSTPGVRMFEQTGGGVWSSRF